MKLRQDKDDPTLAWFTQTWFLQGLMHPLQTPSHLILMLGLALLLGQQGQAKSAWMLPLAVVSGLAINHYTDLRWNSELILLLLSLILGLLLVFRLPLPNIIVFSLTLISGVLLGLDSSPILIPGLGSNSIISWLLGATITISLSIIISSWLAHFLNRFGKGIILRVAGSWIATSAIFVLTLSLAGLLQP